MPRFNVQLTRLTSKHQNLRSDVIVGWADSLPREDATFSMFAPPLEDVDVNSLRFIETTPVINVTEPDAGKQFVFKTKHSTYHVKVLEYGA